MSVFESTQRVRRASCLQQTSPVRRAAWCCLLGVLLLAVSGCAGYSEQIVEARKSVAEGRAKAALQTLNKRLNTKSAEETPPSLQEANVLFLLERATLLQAMGRYELAARDMMMADDRLEFLDLNNAESLELGKYLYSDSAKAYRAPPYERLLLNTLNMANFLAMNEYGKAKVEARRFQLLESFFVDFEDKTVLPRIRALGNYLAGVAFEHSGDLTTAARYYSFAYYYGFQTEGLETRLTDLYSITAYTPGELRAHDKDALRSISQKADQQTPLKRNEYYKKHLKGDVLLLVQTGIAPYKEARRIEINRALEISQESHHSNHSLSDDKRQRFIEVTGSASIAAVKFPVLTQNNVPVERNVELGIQGRETVDWLPRVDVAQQVRHAWKRMRGAIMVAAITRLITRLVASKATRKAAEEASDNEAVGLVAGLVTYGTMEVLDQPDTRSWVFLPGEIRMSRMQLSPGERTVQLEVAGEKIDRKINVEDHGLNLKNFSKHR